MGDFTKNKYTQLLKALQDRGFFFVSFEQFIKSKKENVIILRHDVDHRPLNSLKMAQLENEYEIISTYYFRTKPHTFKPKIIKQIASLGHEIGYHYENLSQNSGDYKKAIKDFQKKLKTLREIYPIKTICMHGSPMSKYDNRLLWEKYDYRDFGIIAEPYFDVNYNEVLYLTDTGRKWDGEDVSIRDKVTSDKENHSVSSRQNSKYSHLRFHSTNDIIRAIEDNRFPPKAMITIHPQRWTNNPILWTKELAWQNTKNFIKKHFFLRK